MEQVLLPLVVKKSVVKLLDVYEAPLILTEYDLIVLSLLPDDRRMSSPKDTVGSEETGAEKAVPKPKRISSVLSSIFP